ncbi:MAG: DUF1761 domain-containing protein [Bacteroidetes bacterium]|nr:DUF1761 domain-containing protein [Bacteroidota bacterium]
MLHINFVAVLAAAFIPMVLGFVWYNQKLFGAAWMKAIGANPEVLQKNFNAPLVFGLSFVFSFLLAMSMNFITIHQFGAYSSMMLHPKDFEDATSQVSIDFAAFMKKYGTNFRTFKHGVLHGILAGFMIALPVIATSAMFERKSAKYIAINAGYWIVCFALMGGIICAWN